MSDDTKIDDTQDTADYKAMYEATQTELAKIKAHQDTLLTETKKAKQEKADQLAAHAKAEQEKAMKDGEFEKLWQSAETNRKNLEQQLQAERDSYKSEKIGTHAMRLAVELADGDAQSAKLLSHFLKDRLTKMAGESGQIDENILTAVKQEFKNNNDYAPLLLGSKAKGGGALGSSSGAAQSQSVTRSEFQAMNPVQQRTFLKSGTVTDNLI